VVSRAAAGGSAFGLGRERAEHVEHEHDAGASALALDGGAVAEGVVVGGGDEDARALAGAAQALVERVVRLVGAPDERRAALVAVAGGAELLARLAVVGDEGRLDELALLDGRPLAVDEHLALGLGRRDRGRERHPRLAAELAGDRHGLGRRAGRRLGG
jgi:hypothetical protein